MKSMTGYGKAVVVKEGRELTIELKSVNHRFLDVSTKIPRAFLAYEDVIRNALKSALSRGHVDVYLNYRIDGVADKIVEVNASLAKSYVDSADMLTEQFPQIRNDFGVTSLMRSPDVLSVVQREEDEAVLREMLLQAVERAVLNLNAMRETEGNKLREDLLLKIGNFETMLEKVISAAPNVVADYREKIRARITEALDGVQLDEGKLANELCFYADKSCIDEEITRLKSHIAHAREILSGEQAVGRKLDFLIQEFNRETNTICSKSGILELTNTALDMKNEIEKIREQVQNLE